MGREPKSYLHPVVPSSWPRVPPDTNSQDRPGLNLHPHTHPEQTPPGSPAPAPDQPVPPSSESKTEDSHRPRCPPPLTTHLRKTGLGPTPGEATGTGARAPQKQAAPPPPHPWRVWEKFQAALQRASGGIAAKSTSQPPARPRGGLAGTPRPPASTFVLAQRRQTTSRAKASPAPPASRGRCSPCSAEAAQGSPELLCSGRDGGGAWGDVAPRAPAESFGGMRAPARAAAAACRGDAR